MSSPPFHQRQEELAADPDFIRWVRQPGPERTAFWQTWAAADPARSVLIEQARELVELLRFDTPALSTEDCLRLETALHDRLRGTAPVQKTPPRVVPLWGQTPVRWAVAASVAVLLVALTYWFTRQARPDWDYQTAYGQTRRIELPDQSVVTLNANSRLRLSDDWDEATAREVWLEGEAYFDVRKKNTRGAGAARFVVHSGDLDVAVLGTTFNVLRRRGTTQVVLNTGRVRLEGLPTGTQLMAPGDRVTYREAARRVERSRVNPGDAAAWQRREWVLNDTPLSEIAAMLNDQFGLTVTLADPALARRTLSGRMSVESPEVFLDNLATILGITVQRTGDRQVTIQAE